MANPILGEKVVVGGGVRKYFKKSHKLPSSPPGSRRPRVPHSGSDEDPLESAACPGGAARR